MVMTSKTETIYHTKTIQVGNAVVTIHRPVLSDKERDKREDAARTALAHFGRTVYGKTN